MTSYGQFCLLPAGRDDARAVLHGLQAVACVGADLTDGVQAQVGEFALFHVRPDVFDGVKLWSIGRERLQHELLAARFDVVANDAAAVSGQAIPDDQKLAGDLFGQRLEEFDELRAAHCPAEEPEVKTPEGNAGDQREVVQRKLYCSTGVCPIGAQVRTRVGRSEMPVSSMKTMVRRSRWAFF